jgi:hypothetical protein
MSRRLVVPCLVVAVFLGGCKSAPPEPERAAASVIDHVGDCWWVTEERWQDWLECHPVAKSVVCGVELGVLTVALVALVVVVLYAASQDGH